MTVSVALAGCTGSIGRQTVEVVAADPDRYRIDAVSVGSSVADAVQVVASTGARVLAVADEAARFTARDMLNAAGMGHVEVVDDLAPVCSEVDVVVNAVVGFAGLDITVATLAAGRRLALANKESLIAAGPVVQPLRATPGAELIPVDSEHSALHQCLRSGTPGVGEVERLILTASGGPFRGRTLDELAQVRREDALAHPTWAMGPKITVDSSTLMNKGLEVIEAHELFAVPYDRIDVVVHPQSVVHSMVEFTDASTIAQLSMPDMRLPIAYALAWPQRGGTPFGRIDWATVGSLTFERPDRDTFRCLDLAIAAGRMGGDAPAVLSAANEVAVEAFLDGRLGWAAISDVVSRVLDAHDVAVPGTVGDVIDADRRGRIAATAVVAQMAA